MSPACGPCCCPAARSSPYNDERPAPQRGPAFVASGLALLLRGERVGHRDRGLALQVACAHDHGGLLLEAGRHHLEVGRAATVGVALDLAGRLVADVARPVEL